MFLRIGSVLAVPVETDTVEVGPVEALRLGKLYMSTVQLIPGRLERVQARVGGRWYELWECGVVNASLDLISLREFLETEYERRTKSH